MENVKLKSANTKLWPNQTDDGSRRNQMHTHTHAHNIRNKLNQKIYYSFIQNAREVCNIVEATNALDKYADVTVFHTCVHHLKWNNGAAVVICISSFDFLYILRTDVK